MESICGFVFILYPIIARLLLLLFEKGLESIYNAIQCQRRKVIIIFQYMKKETPFQVFQITPDIIPK